MRATSATGVVLSEIQDLSVSPGYRWIRADEISSLDELDTDHPAVRLADLRGSRKESAAEGLSALPGLIDHLAALGGLIGVYRSSTGSDAFLAGRLLSLEGSTLVLLEVDPDGTQSADEWRVPLREIISLQWGDDYLAALEELSA